MIYVVVTDYVNVMCALTVHAFMIHIFKFHYHIVGWVHAVMTNSVSFHAINLYAVMLLWFVLL